MSEKFNVPAGTGSAETVGGASAPTATEVQPEAARPQGSGRATMTKENPDGSTTDYETTADGTQVTERDADGNETARRTMSPPPSGAGAGDESASPAETTEEAPPTSGDPAAKEPEPSWEELKRETDRLEQEQRDADAKAAGEREAKRKAREREEKARERREEDRDRRRERKEGAMPKVDPTSLSMDSIGGQSNAPEPPALEGLDDGPPAL
ncbi:MAG: hypothetical protein R8F63_13800 [Acidimicrobiales bacterium]|nr:hypothetical protein [Acidimicrobiales bacterium]